jgi:hypothetical protein
LISLIQNAFKDENKNPLKTLSENWKANDGNLIGHTLIQLKKNQNLAPPSDLADCVLNLLLWVKSSEKDTETPKNISTILTKLGQFIDNKNYRTILREKLQENKEQQKSFQENILFLLEKLHSQIENANAQANAQALANALWAIAKLTEAGVLLLRFTLNDQLRLEINKMRQITGLNEPLSLFRASIRVL